MAKKLNSQKNNKSRNNKNDNYKKQTIKMINDICKKHKKCTKLYSECYFNKCKDENINNLKSIIKPEEIKKCHEDAKGDFDKGIECTKKIMKSRNMYHHGAIFRNCSENKCSEMNTFTNAAFQEKLNSNTNRMMKNPKYIKKLQCIDKNCSPEKQNKAKVHSDNPSGKCAKLYKNYKEQEKCSKISMQNKFKADKKLEDCNNKHCNDILL